MTSTMNLSNRDSNSVGRVVNLHDNVRAISADGKERQLSVDSPVFAHDRIISEGDSKVSIIIDDTKARIDLEGENDIIIDEDIFGGAGAEAIAGATAEVEQVQEAFFILDVEPATDPEDFITDSIDTAGSGLSAADFDGSTIYNADNGNVAKSDKISVIFHESDYTGLDSDCPDDSLNSLLDTDDFES